MSNLQCFVDWALDLDFTVRDGRYLSRINTWHLPDITLQRDSFGGTSLWHLQHDADADIELNIHDFRALVECGSTPALSPTTRKWLLHGLHPASDEYRYRCFLWMISHVNRPATLLYDTPYPYTITDKSLLLEYNQRRTFGYHGRWADWHCSRGTVLQGNRGRSPRLLRAMQKQINQVQLSSPHHTRWADKIINLVEYYRPAPYALWQILSTLRLTHPTLLVWKNRRLILGDLP